MTAEGSRVPAPAAAAILLAAVAGVHGRILGHALLGWDDLPNTLGNPWFAPEVLPGIARFWREAHMDLYMPLTGTLWGALTAIAREPWVFHAASLLLHAAASLAAFGLLRRLVGDGAAALAGALLFAWHPVQVETVAWASGTKDLLAGLLGLLALGSWVDHARARAAGTRQSGAYAAALLLHLLALLSKPSAVAVPLAAAVLDVGIVGRRAHDVARDLAPLVLLSLAWVVLTRSVQPAAGVDVPALELRPLVALDALAFYAGKVLWPASLALDYGRDPARVLEHGRPWASALVPLALAAGLVAWTRLRPGAGARVAAVCVGLLVAGVAPVLGLVPFDFQRFSTVSDHYLYAAMIGPALGLAWALRGARPTGRIVAGVLLAALAARSAVQVGTWKDDETVFRHALAVNPRSWAAHGGLGAALAATGRREEAIGHFRAAIAIRPSDARARANLGTTLDELDRTDEAIVELSESVRLEPRDRVARENLAIALLRRERPTEAEEHLRAALAIQPRSFLAHYYLAGALDRLGRADEALLHLEEAARIAPGFEPARRDLEAVRRARGGSPPR